MSLIQDASFTTLRVNKIVNSSGYYTSFTPTGAVQAIAVSDTVNLTSYATHVTTSDALTVQLPVGTQYGQLKLIRNSGSVRNTLVVYSSDISGGSQVTITSDVGAFAEFLWDGREWKLLDHYDGTLA